MPNPSQKEIIERMRKLPTILRDAMFAEATADKVFEIGTKHDLMIDQVGKMSNEIGNVMLGFTRPDDFAKELGAALKIKEDLAKTIAQDINTQIFYPIRDHLRGVTSSTAPGAMAPAPAAPSMIFPQKMAEVHHEAAQKIVIEPKETKPTTFDDLRMELKNISSLKDTSPASGASPKTSPEYKHSDPYRESTTKEDALPKVASWNPGLKPASPPAATSTPSNTPKTTSYQTSRPFPTTTPVSSANMASGKPTTTPPLAPLPPIKGPISNPPPKPPAPTSTPAAMPVPEPSAKISSFRGYKMDSPPASTPRSGAGIPAAPQKPFTIPPANTQPQAANKPTPSFGELRKALDAAGAPTPKPAAPMPAQGTTGKNPTSNDPYREPTG